MRGRLCDFQTVIDVTLQKKRRSSQCGVVSKVIIRLVTTKLFARLLNRLAFGIPPALAPIFENRISGDHPAEEHGA